MSALGTPLPKQLHTPQPSSAILTHPQGVAGNDKGGEEDGGVRGWGGTRGANVTPTAVSIAGPQPPAKQVCDIMPLVPLRGPREQAGGLEQGRRWRRKQREVRSLPDKLIDNVWETSPQVWWQIASNVSRRSRAKVRCWALNGLISYDFFPPLTSFWTLQVLHTNTHAHTGTHTHTCTFQECQRAFANLRRHHNSKQGYS